jgi:hypothetical protein
MYVSTVTPREAKPTRKASATHARRFLAAVREQNAFELTQSMREGGSQYEGNALSFADGSTAMYIGDSHWIEGESQEPRNYL